MKDKRQKMAFNWPYGDPQMFMHMLSAVAASSNYNSSTIASNQNHQLSPQVNQYHCSKPEVPKSDLLLMSSPQFNGSFGKSSLSPSSEVSSSSICSSADSSPGLTKSKQASDSLVSPISLHIPGMQTSGNFYNYQQQLPHQYMANPYGPQFVGNQIMPPNFAQHSAGMFVDSSSVSFKLPAFGLGQNDPIVAENSCDN